MNKIKNPLWSMLAAFSIMLIFSACSKFLDRKPLGATLNDLGSGSLDAQAFGLYSEQRGDGGFSTLPWLDFNSIRDDDAKKGSSTTDGAEINAEFETFQYTKNDWATNSYWSDHYSMISKCNLLLYTADSLKLTDAASLRNVGEACFFRALSYFDLVKAYGPVPKINYYYTTVNGGIQPKSPVTDIYTLIDSDLNVATNYLPINWNVGSKSEYPGRLTKGAAQTLWAQTHLFRGDWGNVISLCNSVMTSGQYSLDPSFIDIWKDGVNGAGKNGPESIYETQCYVGPNQSPWIGTQWGTGQEVRQGGASVDWNLGWGWNVPTQNLVSAWDSTDPRRNMTILFSGQYDGGPSTGGWGATLPPYAPGPGLDQPYWNKKVYIGDDPAQRTFTGQIGSNGGADWINHRVLRYADVILMLAEASNESGDGATAEKMLEMIRSRARNGGDPAKILPHISFTNQGQMRQAIKNERRWEFALEGYRFYDLVRWGDAPSVLGSLGYQPKNALYPIPQPIIDASHGVLVQNPDYP